MQQPEYIQQLIDNDLITENTANQLSKKTIRALGSNPIQKAIRQGKVTADHLATIAAINPNYVVRMLSGVRFVNLITNNYLTLQHVNALTSDELYQWLFSNWIKLEFYARGIITPELIQVMRSDAARAVLEVFGMPMLLLSGKITIEHLREVKHAETANFLENPKIFKLVASGKFKPGFIKYTHRALSNNLLCHPTILQLISDETLTPELFGGMLRNPNVGLYELIPQIGTLLIEKKIPLEVLANGGYEIIAVIKNYWVQQLLQHNKVTVSQLEAIKLFYIGGMRRTDPLRHSRLHTPYLQRKVRELVIENQHQLDKLIRTKTDLIELASSIPDLRHLLITSVLASSRYFSLWIQGQNDYRRLQAYSDIPGQPLPGCFRQILKHTELSDARAGQARMHDELKVKIAARLLVQGWRDDHSPLAKLPIDLLIIIAANCTTKEPSLSTHERHELASQSVLCFSQRSGKHKRRYTESNAALLTSPLCYKAHSSPC